MTLFHEQSDFQRFIDDLQEVFLSHSLVLHAFCLMGNHFHLFTETPLANLSKAMHRLQSRYASYYKKKYEHETKVFERRYKAILVDSDLYALDLVRYIHRNPVGVFVKDPSSWSYSSYRQYLGLSNFDFVDTSLVLGRFHRDLSLAKLNLQEHMNRAEASAWHPEDYVLGNSIMGADDFIKRIESSLPEDLNVEISGLSQIKSRSSKPRLIQSELLNMKFRGKVLFNLLIYGLRSRTGMTTEQINDFLGAKLSSSSISHKITTIKNAALKQRDLARAIQYIESL